MPALHCTQAEAKAHRKKAAEVTLRNYYENLRSLEYAMEALESIGYQPRAARRMLSRVTALKAPSTGWFRILRRRANGAAILFALLVSTSAWAHGGTDLRGCHTDSKSGAVHCHGGNRQETAAWTNSRRESVADEVADEYPAGRVCERFWAAQPGTAVATLVC